MTKQIKGLGFELDDSNPDTPKIMNPITGQSQRATYTDVLLFTLIEKVEEMTDVLKEQSSDRPPAPALEPILLGDTDSGVATAEEKPSTHPEAPILAEEPAADSEPLEELKPPPQRGRRTRKLAAEGDN